MLAGEHNCVDRELEQTCPRFVCALEIPLFCGDELLLLVAPNLSGSSTR